MWHTHTRAHTLTFIPKKILMQNGLHFVCIICVTHWAVSLCAQHTQIKYINQRNANMKRMLFIAVISGRVMLGPGMIDASSSTLFCEPFHFACDEVKMLSHLRRVKWYGSKYGRCRTLTMVDELNWGYGLPNGYMIINSASKSDYMSKSGGARTKKMALQHIDGISWESFAVYCHSALLPCRIGPSPSYGHTFPLRLLLIDHFPSTYNCQLYNIFIMHNIVNHRPSRSLNEFCVCRGPFTDDG